MATTLETSTTSNPLRPTETARTILIVEDEEAISGMVSMALRYEGYKTIITQSGKDALSLAERHHPDLILLDIMLPDTDGLEILRGLKFRGNDVPVIFLTARDSQADRVKGLRLGADDYICKPFGIAELVARVEVALRRTSAGAIDDTLRFADLELNTQTCEVHRAGTLVKLTATEYRLLQFLMKNARRVLSKQQIMDYVWDYDFSGDPNVVETYISYLRKKLDRLGPPLIHTARGFGYILRVRD